MSQQNYENLEIMAPPSPPRELELGPLYDTAQNALSQLAGPSQDYINLDIKESITSYENIDITSSGPVTIMPQPSLKQPEATGTFPISIPAVGRQASGEEEKRGVASQGHPSSFEFYDNIRLPLGRQREAALASSPELMRQTSPSLPIPILSPYPAVGEQSPTAPASSHSSHGSAQSYENIEQAFLNKKGTMNRACDAERRSGSFSPSGHSPNTSNRHSQTSGEVEKGGAGEGEGERGEVGEREEEGKREGEAERGGEVGGREEEGKREGEEGEAERGGIGGGEREQGETGMVEEERGETGWGGEIGWGEDERRRTREARGGDVEEEQRVQEAKQTSRGRAREEIYESVVLGGKSKSLRQHSGNHGDPNQLNMSTSPPHPSQSDLPQREGEQGCHDNDNIVSTKEVAENGTLPEFSEQPGEVQTLIVSKNPFAGLVISASGQLEESGRIQADQSDLRPNGSVVSLQGENSIAVTNQSVQIQTDQSADRMRERAETMWDDDRVEREWTQVSMTLYVVKSACSYSDSNLW